MDLPAVHVGTPDLVSSQNWPTTTSSLALDSEMTAADSWFLALDQRPFTVDNVRWTTHVVGVHVDGFRTWIQIEFAEKGAGSLLLRLTPWARLHDAINMIRAEIMHRRV